LPATATDAELRFWLGLLLLLAGLCEARAGLLASRP